MLKTLFLIFASVLATIGVLYIVAALLRSRRDPTGATDTIKVIDEVTRPKKSGDETSTDWFMIMMISFYGFLIIAITYLMYKGDYWKYAGMAILAFFLYQVKETIEMIDESELAAVKRFKKFHRDLSPGLNIVWHPFEEVVSTTTRIYERDLPAKPEKIYLGDPTKPKADGSPGDGKVPDGFTPALRVTLAEKVIKEPWSIKDKDGNEIGVTIYPGNSMLLAHTVMVQISYGYEITQLATFYRKMGSPVNAEEKMDDHATGETVAVLQRRCLAEANLLLKQISEEMLISLSNFTNSWGIKVTFFRLKAFGLSHDYNISLTETASAVQKTLTAIKLSEGTRQKTINEGQGIAEARKALLVAEAEGFERMVSIADTESGRYTMANATAREIARQSTVIASGTDGNNLLGSVAAIGQVLRQNQPSVERPVQEKPEDKPAVLHPEKNPSTNQNRGHKGKGKK